MKATEIIALESMGFICTLPGTSISIYPIGSPVATPLSYIIPFGVTPATSAIPMPGAFIMGKYGGKLTAVCKRLVSFMPPIILTRPVLLDSILYYGTSGIKSK